MTDTISTTTSTAAHGVGLSEAAASKVKSLLTQEGRDDLRLRVAVQPGGCSGLRYQLFFDERSLDGDVVMAFPAGKAADDDLDEGFFDGLSSDQPEQGGDGSVEVVVDRMSAPYLIGATIDFVDTIEKQGFTIDNPNATGSCACGDSFH
jgi:Fe-S cluster assembly iron-binding protein IscA